MFCGSFGVVSILIHSHSWLVLPFPAAWGLAGSAAHVYFRPLASKFLGEICSPKKIAQLQPEAFPVAKKMQKVDLRTSATMIPSTTRSFCSGSSSRPTGRSGTNSSRQGSHGFSADAFFFPGDSWGETGNQSNDFKWIQMGVGFRAEKYLRYLEIFLVSLVGTLW